VVRRLIAFYLHQLLS